MNQELLQQEIIEFGSLPETLKLTDKKLGEDGYVIAITRAAKDLTARTLTKKDDVSGNLTEDLLTGDNSFLKDIKDYFKESAKSQEDFDKWHHEECEKVLNKIKKYYSNRNGSDVSYGKAQKIVNMTLKGCYCLNNASSKEKHFENCHMALDSYILKWYKRKGKEKKINTEWSNLSFEEYETIQKSIRAKCKEEKNGFSELSPLQMEFFIWPMEIRIEELGQINDLFGEMMDSFDKINNVQYCKEYLKENSVQYDYQMAEIILAWEKPKELDRDFINWLKKMDKRKKKKVNSANKLLSIYQIDVEKEV